MILFKKYKKALLFAGVLFTLNSCSDDLDVIVDYPKDITFNDLNVGRFSFQIPDSPFDVGNNETGVITVNVVNRGGGDFSGFAISNKNWRSYPWSFSPDFEPAGGVSAADRKAAIDSTVFSVFTDTPNRTETFLVANTEGEDAYIDLQEPSVVEHVLVANNTFNHLTARYGSIYSGTLDSETQEFLLDGEKVRNIKIPNTAVSMYGRFLLPNPDGTNLLRLVGHETIEKRKVGLAAADLARSQGATPDKIAADSTAAAAAYATGYIKLTVDGFRNGSKTNSVDFYLATRPDVDPNNPEHDKVVGDWMKVDLTALGEVDKVLFKMSSSYVDENGKMRYMPYFCLDGVRLRK